MSDEPDDRAAGAAAVSERYYLDNFHTLMAHVAAVYDDLLEEDEKQYYRRFTDASEPAQRLFARLMTRKGPRVRYDRLDYPEIGDIADALDELSEAGLARSVFNAEPAQWLALLTRAELLGVLEAFGCRPQGQLRHEALLETATGQIEAAALTEHLADHYPLVELCRTDLLSIYRLCFFGNFHQDISEFVVAELGHVRYEDYRLQPGARFFDDRDQIDALVGYRGIADMVSDRLAELDSNTLAQLVGCLPAHGGDYRLKLRHDRLVNAIARELERKGELHKALAAYAAAELPPARERRCRLLQKLGDSGAASALLDAMDTDPLDESEADFAARFCVDRGRKQPFAAGIPQTTVEVPSLAPSVEEAAADWYRERGFDAWYVENRLFNGLFGLAFWDIVFEPLADVFCNPFQRAPVDLFEPVFFARRRERLLARLGEIERDDGWRAIVRQRYRDKHGIANRLVHWQWLTEEIVERALTAVRRDHMAAIFHRLLRDLRSNRAGQPDLFVCRGNEYQLVEVKGPGDRLQDHQRRWFECFAEAGIPCQVLNIQQAG